MYIAIGVILVIDILILIFCKPHDLDPDDENF